MVKSNNVTIAVFDRETADGLEIVKFRKQDGPLTKRITLTGSDPTACVMSRGAARRALFDDLQSFAACIGGLASNEAIALGRLRSDLPDEVAVATKYRLNGTARPDLIARTGDHIAYRPGKLALALLDYDTKGTPGAVRERIKEAGGFEAALAIVLPELATAGRVTRLSTSAGISRSDTGERLAGSDGRHAYILVRDGTDIERFLYVLHERAWLAGFGWLMVGAGGQLLERSIVDRMVGAPERLVFEGAPVLEAPLVQDALARSPRVTEGAALDTRAGCPDLNIAQRAQCDDMKVTAKRALAGPAAAARDAFIEAQAAKLATRTKVPLAEARRTVERQARGVLLPGVALAFDDPELAGITVAEVLADPARFVDETLADPLEGVKYGRGKAKVMRSYADGSVFIRSFAHGLAYYDLRHDVHTVEAAVLRCDKSEAANVLATMLLVAAVEADEEAELRELVIQRTGIKPVPLKAKIKAARARYAKQQAEADRDRRSAEHMDGRVQMAAPAEKGAFLPVMEALDHVLCGVRDAEPPMRDIGIAAHPIEVRVRRPELMHELTSAGGNATETEETRLPAPELALLTRHTRVTLGHLIERHARYVAKTKNGEMEVHLPREFIENYTEYAASKLPRVGAIVTNPLVLHDGALLAPDGLDRARRVIFRIDPALRACIPDAAECKPEAVAEAMDYLCNVWLCDVTTDFAGKCTLIAIALSVLERVLLPERPIFLVTAGQAGGGKTTAVIMVVLACTGAKPPAAAWSTDREERRKALLSYLSEGLPVLVWDNIDDGMQIACPSVEKASTAETYVDRVLGISGFREVPATTIMIFNGNNIEVLGALASRKLEARIEVERPDPENRDFIHDDPIGFTLDNRGEIMRYLYTVLLSNPQLRQATAVKQRHTRFKTWWHLVGSAVEHAAAALAKAERGKPLPDGQVAATAIDFGAMFVAAAADDERTGGAAGALRILADKWSNESTFAAADVATFMGDGTGGGLDDVALRGYLDALGNRPMATPATTMEVTTRLKLLTGSPQKVGNRILKLMRYQDAKGKRTAQYVVKVISDAPDDDDPPF